MAEANNRLQNLPWAETQEALASSGSSSDSSTTSTDLGRSMEAEDDGQEKLVAEEQQLVAEEQQLVAEEQLLVAEGQLLVAEGQQLLAEEQQLVAEGQQFEAEGQQLVSEEQQLVAEEQEHEELQHSDFVLINSNDSGFEGSGNIAAAPASFDGERRRNVVWRPVIHLIARARRFARRTRDLAENLINTN